MKLTVFLIIFSFVQLLANDIYAQKNKLSVDHKNTSIEMVLLDIENQSNFKFIYNKEKIDVDSPVSVQLKEKSINEMLDALFEGKNISYTFYGNQIILKNSSDTETFQSIQQKPVSGKVTDSSGSPLPGVSVVVKGTTTGSITDANGSYTLSNVSETATLQFSFVGMKAQEVTVAGKSTINVTLLEESFGIDEVVAIGYGTQKRETLTGAINTVKGIEIVKAPVTNVSNSLSGRLSGLMAVTSSGEPGYDGTTLRIRGSNTFNDNSVLIVVDGVPDRSLDRIDPNSIESITVLKDASAAIYGSRAANGVILVTTKRGKMGRPELTYNAQFGFNQPTKIPKMADAATYATMLNEVAYYDNIEKGLNQEYSADQIQKFRDGSDPLRFPNTDWFGTVLKPMSAQNSHNVTVSGGAESMKYFVSIGTKHQDGNYYNSATYYNQYDFRSNIDGKITKDISVGVDVAGRLEDRHLPIRSAGDIFRGLIQSYPTSMAIWPNGKPGPAIESGRNPVATSTDAGGYVNDKYYKLETNLKLDINIPWVKGLSFSGNLSYDQGFDFKKSFSKPFELYTWDKITVDGNGEPVLGSKTYGGGNDNTPSLEEFARNDFDKLAYGVLNYETGIGENHKLKLMVGSQVSNGSKNEFSAYRDYFLSTDIEQIFAGQTTYQRTNGTGSSNSRLSYFGRVNYSYTNKYLAEFVGRYDGSYIFPEDNRFGFFPGVSLGWITSEENFWKENIGFVNYFKLRGSWGKTGNDRVDAFQYLNSYLLGYELYKDWNYPFVVNSGSALTELKTLYENVLANPDITWEVADQANIGFNARFLNNKLSVEADYFNYKRSNILWPQSANVPGSAGLDGKLPSVNYGKASNQGFDFEISYADATSKDFDYSVSFNASYAKNKVLEWGETEGVPEWQQTTGHPMGSGLYYLSDGIYHTQEEIDADNLTYEIGSSPAPGDIKFVDYSEDGKINAEDRVRIYKNSIPRLTFGSNINLNYKGFDLSMLIQGATGAVTYISQDGGRFGNYFQSFADARWTPENTSATGPRTFNRGNWYWTQSNDYFLHKTDYVRLKTLQIGYTIPSNVLQKTGIENLRVYVSGYNLFTYSPDMKDFDPELGANTTDRDGAPGMSGDKYPLQRVLSLGLTIGL